MLDGKDSGFVDAARPANIVTFLTIVDHLVHNTYSVENKNDFQFSSTILHTYFYTYSPV